MAPGGDRPETQPSDARTGLLEQVHFLTGKLLECREQRALFEAAAAERLAVIEDGARAIAEREARIAALEQAAAESGAKEDFAEALRVELESARAGLATTQDELRQLGVRLAEAQAEVARMGALLELARAKEGEARREGERGMAELAARERALVAEVRALREEGLLQSLRRRLGNLFS